ncbi:MAG: glutathione S-transferase family protein [Pseudomonadota bacterium]
MKLYMLPAAPNPTKVMLYIAEKTAQGVDMGIEQIMVNVFKNEQNSPEHLARNPFGAMPVLETSAGNMLFESLPIIQYLEERFPTPSLWGDDVEARALARTVERVCDVRLLNPSAGYAHAVNSPLGLPENPTIAEWLKPSFVRGLDYVDGLLADGRPFVMGDRVTVADCTLQAALQFLRFRELEDLSAHPQAARWSEAYRARPEIEGVLIG